MIISCVPNRDLYFSQKDIVAFSYQNARSKEVLAELYKYMLQPVMTERVKQGLISSFLDLAISVKCLKHENVPKVASVNHDSASELAILHGFILVYPWCIHIHPQV